MITTTTAHTFISTSSSPSDAPEQRTTSTNRVSQRVHTVTKESDHELKGCFPKYNVYYLSRATQSWDHLYKCQRQMLAPPRLRSTLVHMTLNEKRFILDWNSHKASSRQVSSQWKHQNTATPAKTELETHQILKSECVKVVPSCDLLIRLIHS